jgi:hypothetical protein
MNAEVKRKKVQAYMLTLDDLLRDITIELGIVRSERR